MEERRGRPKETQQIDQPRKFNRVYEDENAVETWKYDLDKFDKGPIEVDIKYKPGAEKRLKQQVKEALQQKKIERQMKKINTKNDKPRSKRQVRILS